VISNNGSGPSSGEILDDIITVAGACFVVATVILVSIMISVTVLPLFFASQMSADELPVLAVWMTLLTFQIAVSGLIVAFVWSISPGTVKFTFALGWPQTTPAGLILLFIIIAGVMAGLSFVTFMFFPADVQRDLDFFRQQMTNAPFVLVVLALVVGAPLSEELLFRGYLMNRLSQTRLGFSGATIISTTGWTLLHAGYSTVGLVEVFLAGLLFSWVLWKTASLWVPIFFHAIYNGTVLTYLVASQQPPAA